MNKLKRILILTSILFSTCHFCMAGGNRDYVEYVNPLMGSHISVPLKWDELNN